MTSIIIFLLATLVCVRSLLTRFFFSVRKKKESVYSIKRFALNAFLLVDNFVIARKRASLITDNRLD